MKRTAWLVTVGLVCVASAHAGDVGFPEDFALAKDRAKALEQLIPGTEDYYFYHCLHHQNSGRLDEVDKLLQLWIKRYNRTRRVIEIENRQQLLRYGTNDAATRAALAYLRTRLGLQFNHQRQIMGQKPKLPTALDPKLIGRDALVATAYARHGNTMNGFEDRALDWAIALDLHPDRRRHLLGRLRRPDYANLPKLVVDDLNHQHSRGFGSHTIHRLLLLDQLEACLKLKADLLNDSNFVNAYLTKLWPSDDADWRNDAAEREAYLDRLWAFASRLAPAHNSLKAHVLYHRLVHDRAKGVYDRDRFMTYVKLPRHVPYVNGHWMADQDVRRYAANLNANYQSATQLPRVGNDEPLVRSYLLRDFVQAANANAYAQYINDVYLKHTFAEAKIVNGVGDMEQWYSMLPPDHYQRLKERVDIDFAYTNKEVFGPDDAVSLDLYVKNVKKLIVKVFEINALNYYREKGREVDTRIELDGLVANEEKTHAYDVPPLRRVKRHFDFAALAKRGTYIVEFIGNGMSSRALIRKGKLRFLTRTGTAGTVFTVLDEQNRKLPKATLWLAGHLYTPDDKGEIAVPFTNRPASQQVILVHDGFASLDSFRHESEGYSLAAGIHVDREALLNGQKANVMVRPTLQLNGTPVTLSVLEDVTLVITSVDREGVSTTKEVGDFKLHEDGESVYELKTPADLARLAFTLKAKVQNLSQGKKIDLAASRTFALNGIDRTDKIEDLHLLHAAGRYTLEVLGKTGEAKPDRPVNFVVKHRDFKDAVHVSLQTDARGRVAIGALADIDTIRATGPEGTAHTWHLLHDDHSYPAALHGKAGDTLAVPYMGAAKQPARAELSLLEKRGSTYVKDRFAALAIQGGFVQVSDLPAGDYDLLLKDSGTRIAIRLTEGTDGLGYVLSERRHLERSNPKPLQIAAVTTSDDAVTITLENASKFARVHVAANRYLPEYPLYPGLSAPLAEPYLVTVPKVKSYYVTGRDIGEEYRYILERKYAKKFPGNLLKRPSLLLNPWAIRTTETGTQIARGGGEHRRMGATSFGGRARGAKKGMAAGGAEQGFANLDFLGQAAVVLANLRPDKNGTVTLKRADLGAHPTLHIVAVDPLNTAYRQVTLPEQDMAPNDLRLAAGLEPDKHFTEQKQVQVVPKGKEFVLDDIATSKLETYDALASVYGLYATLSGNATLVEFGFLLEWPKLKIDKKRELYSKYACHELSFFLYKKDPDFFQQAITPYLANKRDKTFMDHWLLGDDLAAFLQPWNYEQLNVVERILLGQRVRGEQPHAARHVKDMNDLIPPNIERFNHLFKTALKGRALETGDAFGLEKAKSELTDQLKDRAKLPTITRESLRRRNGRAAGGKTMAPGAAMPAATAAPAPPAKPAPKLKALQVRKSVDKLAKLAEKEEADEDMEVPAEEAPADGNFYGDDAKKRAAVRQLYRKLDQTKEWVENNYYHLPIEQQNASLVTVNAFWADYAQHAGDGPFFSTHLAEASRNFTEMMLALAVLDLPFEAAKHESAVAKPKFTLTPGSPMVVFYKAISPAALAKDKLPILVSQNFFRHGERYRHEGNERFDKYVTEEFLIHTVYGAHIVITNPTSARRKLDVLLQIPRGALPVSNGKYTRSVHIDLQPYRTQTFEYYFYFPAPGTLVHYPVHVAKNEDLIAFAQPFTFNVVEQATQIDRTSWDYISQNGTPAQVVAFLRDNNLGRVKLERIAWRMRDRDFFRQVAALLAQRHVYEHTLWSYGLYHNELAAAREYLKHRNDFLSQCGAFIDCKLVTLDPVERKTYQHMEYWPLVNARAHRLGKTRKILNDRFHQQHMRLMNVLAYRPALDDDDRMSIVTYLLLQDRVEEALDFFARVNAAKLATRIQHDYCTAYLAFYTARLEDARAIAVRHADHPVDRWRHLFANVAAQLDEVEGKNKNAKVVDKDDRDQQQAKLAATEPSFDFDVEARQIALTYQNMTACTIHYFPMDIELLFSRNPFVQQRGGQFAFIKPYATQTVKLDPEKAAHTIPLPQEFHSSNVMVEISAGGVTKSKAYYANTLALQLIETYGQVRITHAKTGKPLAKVYVKAYARLRGGRVRFYKDGYTDLRGRFDYASLNTNELDAVDRFSLLVLSDTDGATVREAAAPKR